MYQKVSIFISERSLWNMFRQHTGHHEIDVNTLNQLHEQGEAISPILKDAWCLDVNIVSTDVFPFVFRDHLAAHEWTGKKRPKKSGVPLGKSWLRPCQSPKKQQESWETLLSSVLGRTFKEAVIKNHSWRNENFSYLPTKKRVITVISGRFVKCNTIFSVCDLWALWALICSPVWIQYMETPC